jgi:iron complex outermembrane receptor protein
MKKLGIFLSLIFSFNISFSSSVSIEELLKEYEKAEALKTVSKNLGITVVFTRDDIEKLQLYTLADVLKLIPVGSYYVNNFGVGQFVFAGVDTQSINYQTRIYLNGHELSSINTSSPFLTYDYFPLDNIDKIEVYLTYGNSPLSAENGLLIIKMYSKDPKKENVSTLRTTFDTKNSYTFSFSDARQISPETSYFLMASVSDLKFEKQLNNLNRNQRRKHFYLKLNYLDTSFQLSGSDVKRGLFAGFSPDFSPDYGGIRSTGIFASISQKMLDDKSLKILFSFDYQRRNYEESNTDYGVLFLPYVNNKNGIPIYLNDVRTFAKNTFNIEKTFKLDRHFLDINLIYQNYQQNAEGRKIIYPPNITVFNYEPKYVEESNFSSVYLDDTYKITSNLNFNLNVKYSYYSWSRNKDTGVLNFKSGFLYNYNRYSFRTYISRMYIPPPFIFIEMSDGNLKPVRHDNFFMEHSYSFKNNKITFDFNYDETYDYIIPAAAGYENLKEKIKAFTYFIQYIHSFDNLDITAQGWINHVENVREILSPTKGANLILKGNISNVNYFTEVLYRDKFEAFGISVNSSVDLSAGFSYNFKDGTSVKLKGENLLNSSSKAIFITPVTKGTYNSLDRKIYITLEKFF